MVLVSEMILNALDRLTKILEHGLQVHVQTLGDVFQFQVFFKTQAEDGAVRLFEMPLGVVVYGIYGGQMLRCVMRVGVGFHGIQVFHFDSCSHCALPSADRLLSSLPWAGYRVP